MRHKQQLGRWGESVAATHLIADGYQIVARNWRCRYGEIDLVAQRNGVTHFVEVKTRRGTQMGSPEEAISSTKLTRMKRSALTYLSDAANEDPAWTIDLIAIQLDVSGKLIRLSHIHLN